MKDFILAEIRRIARQQDGIAPGQGAFAKLTGITPAKWRGVHWLRWSDALAEAGVQANDWNQKLDSEQILLGVATLTRRLGRIPTNSEIRMERKRDAAFPAHSTVNNHFKTKASIHAALQRLSSSNSDWTDLRSVLGSAPSSTDSSDSTQSRPEGFVYLLASGEHFKIGRSENIERRVREVSIAMPDKVTLVHSIRTDDPAGIEAYWHRRFAASRTNGEWFKLSGSDIRAFRKRTFQ